MAIIPLLFQSVSEITSRPRYKIVIDPEQTQFSCIVGYYRVNTPIRCSITSCQQPHNKGVLVELADGSEAIIGHVCGEKYFGKSLLYEIEDYERKITQMEIINELISRKYEVQDLLSSVIRMCNDEGDSLGKQQRNFRRLFPNLTKQLQRRAAREEYTITHSRKRTNEEVKLYLMNHPGSPKASAEYEEIAIGNIAGLNLFLTNIYNLLNKELREPMEAFLDEEVHGIPAADLSLKRHWAQTLRSSIERAKQAIADASAFFSEENIQKLRQLEMPADELKRLKYPGIQQLKTINPLDTIQEESSKFPNRRARRGGKINAN